MWNNGQHRRTASMGAKQRTTVLASHTTVGKTHFSTSTDRIVAARKMRERTRFVHGTSKERFPV